MGEIKWTPLSGDFNHQLYEFLRTSGIEGFVDHVYTDTKGIPTFGIGFALIDGSPGNYFINASYLSYLSELKIISTIQRIDLTVALNEALKALNNGKGTTDANPFVANKNNFLGWTISGVAAPGQKSQAEQFFDKIVSKYSAHVQNWLGSSQSDVAVFNALKGTQELLALTSHAYNGLINVGHSPHLRQAILDGNRAEAWYQIRYQDPSPAERRYAEAAMFGLYNYGETGPNVTKEEALQIYQMCTAHGLTTMRNYDSQHLKALQNAEAITYPSDTNFPKATDLRTSLGPAAQELSKLYGDGQSFDPLDIFAASANRTDVSATLTVPNSPALLLAGSGADTLVGALTGNDVLVAGTGSDVLEGGTGVNRFDMGALASVANVTDTINDSGGQGSIWLGATQLGGGSGLTLNTASNGSLVWTASDGTQYAFTR